MPSRILVFAAVLGLSFSLSAQEISISDGGLYTDCGFSFVDDGATAADASPNADFTMTFCPDLPVDPVLNFSFNLFALGAGDTLFMWLSDEAVGPPDDVFTGSELQSQNIWSQMNDDVTNATGCITWQFTSDAADNSNWTAFVSCEEPCLPPEAIVQTTVGGAVETVPLQVCAGEEIDFDGSGSTAAEDFLIANWEWDFDDGSVDSSGPQVSHSFEEPGVYNVQLTITDNNDCENTNLVDHLIQVSTPTSFVGTTQDLSICTGEEYPVQGVAEGILYVDAPNVDFGGGLFIPDDQTQCFSSSIVYTAFSSGQVVQSPADIENLFINFEHSFMGDLTITFLCPNGNAMGVHQQGGGSTFLGVPVDVDGQPNDEGIGYDYYWSSDATNGTWSENAGGTLPSGTYESAQPWTLLEGCPLNGTWTIEVCDSWASDNGFIFDWSVNFDASLFPEDLSFTPQVGADCDSSFWTGPFIVDDGGNCSDISILPENQGTFEYIYTATNNFGCTSSDTMVVTVLDGPEVEFDAMGYTWCPGGAVDLSATATNVAPGTTLEWSWDASEGDLGSFTGNNSEGSAVLDGLDAPADVTVTINMTGGEIDECLASDVAPVGIYPPPSLGPDQTFFGLCLGETHLLVPDLGVSEWDLEFAWSSEIEGELDETGGTLNVTASDVYTVVVSMAEPCIGEDAMSFDVNFSTCAIEAIPSVFTPNGDRVNDDFEVDGASVSFLGPTLTVYNRWGQVVFYREDYKNTWSPDETEAAEGTYYVTLDVSSYDLPLEDIEHNGVITANGGGFRYVGPLQILRDRQ